MKLQIIKIITFLIFICFATISTVASENNNSTSDLVSNRKTANESTVDNLGGKTEIPPTTTSTTTTPSPPKTNSIISTLLSITKFITGKFIDYLTAQKTNENSEALKFENF